MVLGILLLVLAQAPQEELVPDVDILALDEDMLAFLKEIEKSQDPARRLYDLVYKVFSPDFLNLEYDGSKTKTAIETFQTRNGNCLSFTTMFVAMARYLGIDASFQQVSNIPTWNKHGEMVVLNRHMNARVFIHGRQFNIDFNPWEDRKEIHKEVISDTRAFAQYYNNIGAEAFSAGEVERAMAFFRKAVSVDPELSFAWSNLGVAYKHAGRIKESEQAYLSALEFNKREYTAMNNLARLYKDMGRNREARHLLRKVEDFRDRNPYYHFKMGEQAYIEGEYREAIRSFKKAIQRKATDHEFYFALARTYAKLGDQGKVAYYIKKAKEFAPDSFNKDRYSQKLEMLAKN